MNGNRTVAVAGAFVRAFALGLVLCAGSGCVAFNVGEPEIHRERGEPRIEKSVLSFHESPGIFVSQTNELVYIGIAVNVESAVEFRTVKPDRTITRQRKMAFGLFPGWAESIYSERSKLKGELAKCGILPWESNHPQERAVGTCAFPIVAPTVSAICLAGGILYTPYAMFVEPFHGQYDCFKNPDTDGFPSLSAHMAVAGFHRFTATTTENNDIKGMPRRTTERETRLIPGPWWVRLSVPSVGFSESRPVTSREHVAVFRLPETTNGGRTQGTATFTLPERAMEFHSKGDREFLWQMASERHPVPVTAPGKTAIVAPTPSRPPEKKFEVLSVERQDDGQYLARVEIMDKSNTFSIIHLIKAEVFRLAREEFWKKYPSEPEEFVRESMDFRTEKDGKFLYFTGWVFSVRPVEDGWFYDDQSRTGWIRLRVSGGIPAAEAERWAHENIGEIVKNKNVVLETGTAPPSGAQFRSRSERCEGGVLTVEFEALE